MADEKLSELDTAISIDFLYGISSGVSKKIAPGNVGGGISLVTPWVDISSADILALDTTDKVIVAAQGANKIIVPVVIEIKFAAGAVPYTGGSALKAVYAGMAWNEHLVTFDNILLETDDQFGWGLTAQETRNYFANTECVNTAVVLKIHPLAGPFVDGDGIAKVRTFYHLVDIT